MSRCQRDLQSRQESLESLRRRQRELGQQLRELAGRKRAARASKPIKQRLKEMLERERDTIVFGKSGIHGWGLMARRAIPQDTFITEYRGDVVRRPVADVRERGYRARGKDCYLFALGDAVIDATDRGHIARFANHACTPCMYAKTVEVDGREHLVFISRSDIRMGQELTFNYRFQEDEDGKIPCDCGAPNCSGSMN